MLETRAQGLGIVLEIVLPVSPLAHDLLQILKC